MLNAYRGIFSDRIPVAPEFWSYYPAKVLGVNMIEFEREIPLWKALLATFKKYGTEGWGIACAEAKNPLFSSKCSWNKIDNGQYRLLSKTSLGKRKFISQRIYDKKEPSWMVEYPAKNEDDLLTLIDINLSDKIVYDFNAAKLAYKQVGESYLLELYLGDPFFDFAAGFLGFENSAIYFNSNNDQVLGKYFKRYVELKKSFIRQAVSQTEFESFFIGCAYSCNSLIGPRLWRKWDKLFIAEMVKEIHKYGRLVHLHFHGKSKETIADFAELKIDCVCPFERPPGGDIDGPEGLKTVRRQLGGDVTMMGNVHTVETLIRGKPADVRREVREIKDTFRGSARFVISTGDQVGKETPEENIWAMIEESRL